MELTPTEIRRQQFEQVRRGFDPQEVGVFLEQVASIVATQEKDLAGQRQEIQRLERALDEARAAEEAVRLTMLAATKAKEEILAGAAEDADQLLEGAQARAEAVLTEARREALALIEASRKDAEEMMAAASAEHEELLARADTMRDVVKKAGTLLKGMAAGALADIDKAASLLDVGQTRSADFEFARGNEAERAAPVLDPVDRLLAELREVGG